MVYAFGGEDFGPTGLEGVGSFVRVGGRGAVLLDNNQINGFAVKGRPGFEESFKLCGSTAFRWGGPVIVFIDQ